MQVPGSYGLKRYGWKGFVMEILKMTKDNFKDTVEKADKLLVVDFWATWCARAVLAGPTFASEIGERVPTISVLASMSDQTIAEMRKLLETDYLRTIVTNDVLGVELCSVLKNVYAAAVGIIEGMDMGDNLRGTIAWGH